MLSPHPLPWSPNYLDKMQANITKIVTDFEMSNVPLLIIICRSVPNDCCVVFVCVLSMRCNCTQLNMQQLSQVKVVQADEWYVGQLSRALGEKGFAASQASRFLNPLATWQLGNLTTSQAALNDTTLLPPNWQCIPLYCMPHLETESKNILTRLCPRTGNYLFWEYLRPPKIMLIHRI